MNVFRTWIAASLMAIVWPAPARAQNAPTHAADPPINSTRTATIKARPQASDGPFLVKPYLQLGYTQAVGKLELLWHAADLDADWSVEYRPGPGTRWQATKAPAARRVAVAGIDPHRVYRRFPDGPRTGRDVRLPREPGGQGGLRVRGPRPKVAGQPQRFVAFGDCGAGTPEQKAIAYRTFATKPDYVLITGDIVYGKGLISEYRDKFWPIYNADDAVAELGRPLLRSTLFVAAAGNHDIASRDLGKLPDGLAYFYYWTQPLNGPVGREGRPDHGPGPRPRGEPKGVPRRRRPRLPARWRISPSTTATSTGRSSTPIRPLTGPATSCDSGSSATSPPPRARPGGS